MLQQAAKFMLANANQAPRFLYEFSMIFSGCL